MSYQNHIASNGLTPSLFSSKRAFAISRWNEGPENTRSPVSLVTLIAVKSFIQL